MSQAVPIAARPTYVRYRIIALIFLITSINYADRATFSIAGNAASGELGLSPVQTGFILSAFAWAYVLAQIPGGALLDRFGTKKIYAGAIAIWSIFTAIQGTVGLIMGLPVVASLFVLRFLVGAAEAPSFPGNLSRQCPAGRRLVPRRGTRYGLGHLQQRAIFLAGRLRPADGLVGP